MDLIAVAEKFCAGWTALDSQAFSMLFAPDGFYTDIGFGITRRGRDHVREHHQIWRAAVPEFAMLKEHAHESGRNIIVQTICYGTFSGQNLGGSKLKATFKPFRARAISVLELDDNSKSWAARSITTNSRCRSAMRRRSIISPIRIRTWQKRLAEEWPRWAECAGV